MRTARDNAVWKVRVLLRVWGQWKPKTYFYSREFHITKWRETAERRPDYVQIDFIGKYSLEEESGTQDDHHHDGQLPQGQ
ncbi:hypothetical protein [Streptomyces sp. NPDC002088]|uniref:hypothetical protein n=1 Tax=Streptomyces sp. NPDC002088 TaxID=3154665 RepID=UPI00332BF1E3